MFDWDIKSLFEILKRSCRKTRIGYCSSEMWYPKNLHFFGKKKPVIQVDDFWESHLVMDRLTASWLWIQLTRWTCIQVEVTETKPSTWVKCGDGYIYIYIYIFILVGCVHVYGYTHSKDIDVSLPLCLCLIMSVSMYMTMARGVWPSACGRIVFDSLRDWDHGRLGSRSGDFTLSSSGVSVGWVNFDRASHGLKSHGLPCHVLSLANLKISWLL